MRDKSQYTLIQNFLASDRKSILSAIAASVTSGACSALLIAFIGKQFVSPETFGSKLIFVFLLLLIISLVTNLVAAKMLISASGRHVFNLRIQLCQRILSTPFSKIEKIGTDKILAMLTEDLNSIAVAFTQIPILTTNVTRVFFCMLYLLWLSPMIVLMIMGACVPVVYVLVKLYKKAKRLMTDMYPIRDQRFELYTALTAGIKELKINGYFASVFFEKNLLPNAKMFKEVQEMSFMANQVAINWGQFAYFMVIFGLLVLASSSYIDSELVVAFALVGLFVRGSITSLLQASPIWIKASTAIDKINALDFAEISSPQNEVNQPVSPAVRRKHKLKLSNLGYTYVSERGDEATKVGPFDLTLESGQIVFITGGNGSGKTSLVKLITTLYEPCHGDLYLNDVQIDEANLSWYRSHFHAVFSDFYTFDSIYANLGHEKQLNEYLHKLQLDMSLMADSNRFDSKLLSSGQKARIALLPVFLLDKPILIFDEWAANQDPLFKKVFYHELLPELKQSGKLVIVITHDDRYFDIADSVIKLESGQVSGLVSGQLTGQT